MHREPGEEQRPEDDPDAVIDEHGDHLGREGAAVFELRAQVQPQVDPDELQVIDEGPHPHPPCA